MRDLALAVCALLAFLVPVGSYCFILAIINRRQKPLVVQGYWDTVGLLAAGSGFFLITVPMLLSELSQRFHGEAGADWFDAPLRHWLLWIVYLLFLVTGCLWMMLWRIHKTVIYNVDTENFREVFQRAVATVGLEVKTEQFGHLTLAPAPPTPPDDTSFSEQPVRVALPTMNDVGYAKLQVEQFPALCHITLHWEDYPEHVRQQVERELDKSLTAPEDNPGAGWFLSISGLVFGVLFTITLIILITIWRMRDH